MKDKDKTKEKLIDELVFLRERVAGLDTEKGSPALVEGPLLASESKFQIVADNTYDWEYWVSPEGVFLYTSPSCQRICGYSAGEFKANPELLS